MELSSRKRLLYMGEYDPIGRIYIERLCFSMIKTACSRIANCEREKKINDLL
jgi:hypothetical protein